MFLAKCLRPHARLEALRSDGAYHIVLGAPHDWLRSETQYKPVIYNGMRERSPTGTVLTFTSIKARCEADRKKKKKREKQDKAAHTPGVASSADILGSSVATSGETAKIRLKMRGSDKPRRGLGNRKATAAKYCA